MNRLFTRIAVFFLLPGMVIDPAVATDLVLPVLACKFQAGYSSLFVTNALAPTGMSQNVVPGTHEKGVFKSRREAGEILRDALEPFVDDYEPGTALQVLRDYLKQGPQGTKLQIFSHELLRSLLGMSGQATPEDVQRVFNALDLEPSDNTSSQAIAVAVNQAKNGLTSLVEDVEFRPKQDQLHLIGALQNGLKAIGYPKDKEVLLFGSWPDDRQKTGSDVDLAFKEDTASDSRAEHNLRLYLLDAGYDLDGIWNLTLQNMIMTLKLYGARQHRVIAITQTGWRAYILSHETPSEEKVRLQSWANSGREIQATYKVIHATRGKIVLSVRGTLDAVVETVHGLQLRFSQIVEPILLKDISAIFIHGRHPSAYPKSEEQAA